jgi:hypothetical protein
MWEVRAAQVTSEGRERNMSELVKLTGTENYTDVVVTVATVVNDAYVGGHVITKVFRYEFETEEDALMFLDTSNEPKGLMAVQQMGA